MAQEEKLDPEERYQYIGFEVFRPKPAGFWKDDNERKSYVQQVREELGSIYRKSVVYASILTKTDRIFISIAAVMMILAPFLPWVRAHTLYGSSTFGGIFGIFSLGSFWFYVSKMSGFVVPLTIFLMIALSLMSIVLGVMTLAAVYGKAKSEDEYIAKLKKVLKLHMVPLFTFLFIILLSLFGQTIPFGSSLGIKDLGSSYNFVTLMEFTTIGFWLAVFGVAINYNKSREL